MAVEKDKTGAAAGGGGKREASSEEDKIGLIERKEYDKLKRRAIRFEKSNRKYILIIPCDGDQGWCEMGEYSALIYKYRVCMELGVPVSLTDDSDSYYIQYEIGRIRVRGFDSVRRRLKKAGLYKSELLKDKCMLFELNQVFTEEELTSLSSEERQRQAQINNIVDTKFADPALYQMMIEVGTRLHKICARRLDKFSSSTNGRRMVMLMDNMMREYFDLAMLKLTPDEQLKSWRQMLEYVRELLVEVQIAAGLKLWTRSECAKVGESIIEVRKRIEKDLKNEAKRLRERNRPDESTGPEAMAA